MGETDKITDHWENMRLYRNAARLMFQAAANHLEIARTSSWQKAKVSFDSAAICREVAWKNNMRAAQHMVIGTLQLFAFKLGLR